MEHPSRVVEGRLKLEANKLLDREVSLPWRPLSEVKDEKGRRKRKGHEIVRNRKQAFPRPAQQLEEPINTATVRRSEKGKHVTAHDNVLPMG